MSAVRPEKSVISANRIVASELSSLHRELRAPAIVERAVDGQLVRGEVVLERWVAVADRHVLDRSAGRGGLRCCGSQRCVAPLCEGCRMTAVEADWAAALVDAGIA